MNILKTKKLLKSFDGVHAVDHLSINIEKGKITSIIGPNGSGKTTLMHILTGILPMDGGMVVISDVELKQIKPYNVSSYGISRTFQTIRLIEQISVLDNIMMVLTEKNVFSSLFEKHSELHQNQVKEILQKVGLWEKRDELAENLSYGQRKLLEIGRGIAPDPEILLLDEPFAGLFPEMVKTVTKIIEEFRKEGKTIVLIEHNMDLIRQLSDHVIVMDSGKLLAQGKPDKVLAQKDVIEAYLGD